MQIGRQAMALTSSVPMLPPISSSRSRPSTPAVVSQESLVARARASLLQATGVITPAGPPARQQAAAGFYFHARKSGGGG